MNNYVEKTRTQQNLVRQQQQKHEEMKKKRRKRKKANAYFSCQEFFARYFQIYDIRSLYEYTIFGLPFLGFSRSLLAKMIYYKQVN